MAAWSSALDFEVQPVAVDYHRRHTAGVRVRVRIMIRVRARVRARVTGSGSALGCEKVHILVSVGVLLVSLCYELQFLQ